MTALNINEAEAQHGTKIASDLFDAPSGPKINYAVPNFGKDRELLANDESLSQAEGQLGQKFEASSLDQPKGYP